MQRQLIWGAAVALALVLPLGGTRTLDAQATPAAAATARCAALMSLVSPETKVKDATHSTQGKVDRTRPLCPYPQVAKYKGTGSIDEAGSFACAF